MSLSTSLWKHTRSLSRSTRKARRTAAHRSSPKLEALEGRAVPAVYNAATPAALIADINAANKSGGASTITLTAPSTSPYVLSAANNAINGANGLPVIGMSKAVNLTIIGSGDTIERSAVAGTAAFRLLEVSAGSTLTLEYVTLQNGAAQGSGAAADGGAIYNQGSLTLVGGTVQNNAAQGNNGANGLVTHKKSQEGSIGGQTGEDAAGGAIWSSGSMTVEEGTVIQGNQALGGQGGGGGVLVSTTYGTILGSGAAGGGGFGGGIFEAGGSVNIASATLTGNTAAGGTGGNLDQVIASISPPPAPGLGGIGAGGGLYAAGGTLSVSSATVQTDQALGGTGGGLVEFPTLSASGGAAYGGGINVAGGTATLAMTDLLANVALGGTGGYGSNVGLGGNGGNAFGGGLYAAGGSLTLKNDTITGNEALGGNAGNDNLGSIGGSGVTFPIPGTEAGGGIEIASSAAVNLDSYTVANTTNNNPSDIDGTYVLVN